MWHCSFVCAIVATMLAVAIDSHGQTKSGKSGSANVEYFNQGWDTEMRHLYYFTPQGSHLMPYDWFLAIEQVRSTRLFSDPKNLKKHGWLWAFEDSSKSNPDNLPIGFTKSEVNVGETGKWMGWTCAACHTGEMVVNDHRYRVDGGPANVDLGRFLRELAAAVQANAVDSEKFGRFAKRVLGSSFSSEAVATLKRQFLLYSATLAGRIAMRTPTFPEGPGRVDALGQIITAMSVFQLGEADNYQSPDAPTSFPFLWYTPKLAWVQWSPISSNPIGRNAGEVLGVFGHADFVRDERDETHEALAKSKIDKQTEFEFMAKHSAPEEKALPPGATIGGAARYKKSEGEKEKAPKDEHKFLGSTVLYTNLFHLEQWIDDLSAPKWDESVFGKIDHELGASGAKLFKRDCRSCHNMPPFDMTSKEENIIGKQFIKIGKTPYKVVGTDSAYVESLITRFSKTGDLGPVLFENETVVPAASFFLGGVAAVVKKGLDDLGLSEKQKLVYSDFRYYPPESPGAAPKPYRPTRVTDLKAGPLLGIWATGPFLHNGSVPNLYELLSPPESRSKVFWTGNHELDTKKLGFVSKSAKGLFRLDTTLKGNGNGGHIYPSRPYSDSERWAVIEFLKDPTLYQDN